MTKPTPHKVLYSFRRCPYAIRARMALKAAGITYEHREVSLRNKPAALLEASPKGTVPVLILEDGTVIDESWDILVWATEQNDRYGWHRGHDVDEMRAWLERLERDFKPAMLRYKYHERYPDSDRAEAKTDAEKFLRELDARLAEHDFLLITGESLADIALFPFIRQYAIVDLDDFEELPLKNLMRWFFFYFNGELFNSVMDKFPVWEPQDT